MAIRVIFIDVLQCIQDDENNVCLCLMMNIALLALLFSDPVDVPDVAQRSFSDYAFALAQV